MPQIVLKQQRVRVLVPEFERQQPELVVHFGRLPLFLPPHRRLNRVVKINIEVTFFGFLSWDDIEIVAISEERSDSHVPIIFLVILPFKSDKLAFFWSYNLFWLFKSDRVYNDKLLLGLLRWSTVKQSIHEHEFALFMQAITLVHIYLAEHLITILTQSYLEKT